MAQIGYGKIAIREPRDRLVDVHSTSFPNPNDGFFGQRAPIRIAQRAPTLMSSLFNHGDPDLSFCDAVAAGVIETESDQPSTVDVEKFTDLMLFPDLMGVFDEDLPAFQDFPIMDPLGGALDGPLKPREAISSVASAVTSDGGEMMSPAESEASVDHFFNTFTDLTGFLEQLTEEAGPSDLDDLAASITESNYPLTTDAEPSAMATTIPPTNVGPETATEEAECSETEAPPPKKARTSRAKAQAVSKEAKYRQRRDKNNVASQRSRATRKRREADMATQAEELEAENARLRVQIEELTVIAEEARKCLVSALSQK